MKMVIMIKLASESDSLWHWKSYEVIMKWSDFYDQSQKEDNMKYDCWASYYMAASKSTQYLYRHIYFNIYGRTLCCICIYYTDDSKLIYIIEG